MIDQKRDVRPQDAQMDGRGWDYSSGMDPLHRAWMPSGQKPIPLVTYYSNPTLLPINKFSVQPWFVGARNVNEVPVNEPEHMIL